MSAVHPPALRAWNTAGKIFWTFLAVTFPWVITEGASGWVTFLALLHSAWFLRLAWGNPTE